jgi:ABC-type nickel/cobalt efflux system permease component RcnA
MLTLLSIIVIGFFLGMRHATDPDHVIAVTTIVSRQRSVGRAALIGASWGLGHTVTIFGVGTAIILFNVVIPTRLGLSMELSVSIMLIGLGVWNLVGFLRSVPGAGISVQETMPLAHSHPHAHGDLVHSHLHSHSAAESSRAAGDEAAGKTGVIQFFRPLMVGIVHGLAGSAAVALLILASIRNPRWAIVYLLIFGIGTIAGMMLITIGIASTFRLVGSRFRKFNQRLAMVSGVVSLAFGVFLAYQICFVQGLLSNHPQWTPH